MHLKALVIQDLYRSFDVHAIAGDILSSKLIGSPFALSPETETEPTTPIKKKRKRTSKAPPSPNPSNTSPTKSMSSSNSPILPNSSAKKSPARSPPGFPTSPMFSYSPRPALPMQPTNQRSPLSVNIACFTAAFGSADLIDDLEEEQEALAMTDPDGRTNYGYDSGSFEVYGSRDHTRGPLYRSGDGRLWCSRTCRASIDPPHNGGQHTQWQLPAGFQPCGYMC